MASRVLGGFGSFSEVTRQRVTEAAAALNYRPNVLARSLRIGRTKAIGVVASNIQSFAWTTFIRTIEAAASQRGYQIILGATYDDPEAERAYLKSLHERHVDGIIVAPAQENLDTIKRLIKSGVPVVLISAVEPPLDAPSINMDNRAFARQATQHLLELGHRRIGIITGNLALPAGELRLLGYQDALREAGLEVADELIGVGEFRFEPAYEAALALIDLPQPPTAMLVCNDLMTGAALQALKDRDVKLPEEMSLVAFDDPTWASFHRPGITTVRTPHARMAELALETLLAGIDTPSRDGEAAPEALAERGRRVVLAAELVVRESALEHRD